MHHKACARHYFAPSVLLVYLNVVTNDLYQKSYFMCIHTIYTILTQVFRILEIDAHFLPAWFYYSVYARTTGSPYTYINVNVWFTWRLWGLMICMPCTS